MSRIKNDFVGTKNYEKINTNSKEDNSRNIGNYGEKIFNIEANNF